jgi:hypothetical protein
MPITPGNSSLYPTPTTFKASLPSMEEEADVPEEVLLASTAADREPKTKRAARKSKAQKLKDLDRQ